jgi:3-oxoacyl-[acyl-carrier protein] reductase
MRQENEQVVLITGGTRGIGAAAARLLAGKGVKVAINGRRMNRQVEDLLADIEASGGEARFCEGDVSNPAAVRGFVGEVWYAWGRLDGLVCAAGINIDRPFQTLSLEDWHEVLEVNLTGTFLSCQAAAPALKASGRGSIITLASQTAFRGRTNGTNYCAAKAGVVALTKCIAQELAPDVRANVIVPGLIETDEVVERLHLDDPLNRTGRVANIPLKRIGQPEDVAEIIEFLLSERAAYITGQTFWVNGGMMMP